MKRHERPRRRAERERQASAADHRIAGSGPGRCCATGGRPRTGPSRSARASRTSSATTSARRAGAHPRTARAARCSAWSTSPTCSSPTSSRRPGSSSSTRNFADRRYAEIIPVQRPQEALTVHAVDATIRTVSAVRGPATGPAAAAGGHHRRRDRQRAVERAAGLPRPVRRRPGRPRTPAARTTRACSRRTGRVTSSGGPTGRAPAARTSSGASSASRTTPACCSARCASSPPTGLSMPWLSCFGNHEALNQGVGTQTPGWPPR